MSTFPGVQDAEWATKKRGQPFGGACQTCKQAVAMGWPLKSWDQFITEMRAHPELKVQAEGAVRCVKQFSRPPPAFTPEDFVKHTVLGYSVRRHYRLLSKSQFLAKYGVDAGVVNAPVDTVRDDSGAEIHGILVEADKPEDGVEVQSFRTTYTDLQQLLQNHEAQVRCDQASDFCKEYLVHDVKTLPRGFRQKVSEQELLSRVAKYQAEQKRKADEAAALSTLVAPELQREAAEKELAEEAEKESTDSEDANEHAAAVPGLHLLPVDKKKGQSGRKGQGKADRTASAKAKSKSKAKTDAKGSSPGHSFMRLRSKAEDAPTHSRAGDTASVAGSSASTASKKRLTSLEKSRVHRKVLVLPNILENSKELGRQIWQAQETMSALDRSPRKKNDPDTVLLRSHLQKALQAQDVALQ